MADSENSRTLSSVTRRTLLTGTTAAAVAWPFNDGAGATKAPVGNAIGDPALELWRAWKVACLNTAALGEKQQRLEAQLVNTVGFPCAEVHLPEKDTTLAIWWQGEIGNHFGDDFAFADIRAKAEADLAAHQARWDAEDERIGYSAAMRAERIAADREQELVDALTVTPATTLAGVAGKLNAVMRESEFFGECTDFPWPLVRSALDDIVRIARHGRAS